MQTQVSLALQVMPFCQQGIGHILYDLYSYMTYTLLAEWHNLQCQRNLSLHHMILMLGLSEPPALEVSRLPLDNRGVTSGVSQER